MFSTAVAATEGRLLAATALLNTGAIKHFVSAYASPMGTDSYGGIEVRHPGANSDWYDGEPWFKILDLYPLLEDGGPAGAYPAYAYLFGIRNSYGFEPLAPARGLPDDVSGALRDDLQGYIESGELIASWIGWDELAALDPDEPFGHIIGYLESNDGSPLYRTLLLQHGWTAEAIKFAGPAAVSAALTPADAATWEHDGATYWYRPMTLGSYFGDGTPWGHVLSVMRALAGRFGSEGVRLIAAFD
ncbi:hypothetical protein [Promicromonospora sp. NPDC050262]|uniref:hypothetical protein n=1 Tax=Promicromonospora sp. NPDC050262 TaxID=3155036 RepID=UPI00340676A8